MSGKEFEFTLILSGIDELTDDILNQLYQSNCGDALFGVRDGVVLADFAHESTSFLDAILSAIEDIHSAGVGAKVVHVEPDELVTMSEIARRFKVTREGVRKWVLGVRGPGGFPPPVGNVTRHSPLWRWTDVLRWHRDVLLAAQPNSPTVSEESRQKTQRADEVAAVNAALDLVRYAGAASAQRLVRKVAGQHAGSRR